MAIKRIRHRRGTAQQWTDANPVLKSGEIGIELDSFTLVNDVRYYLCKLGDDETAWNDLPYSQLGVPGGAGPGGPVSWNDIQDKPTEFTPSAHTHSMSSVNGLISALAGKANVGDVPPLAATAWSPNHATALGNPYTVDTLVWYQGNVYRCKANNDGLVPTSELYWELLGAGKLLAQEKTFSGDYNDLTNVPSQFTPSGHTHEVSDINGLGDQLSAKADLVDGYIPSSQIPAQAISEFLGDVLSEKDMLALNGQVGDWCIRTDEDRTYILAGNDPSDIGSWRYVVTPGSGISSVNGQTGVVVLGKSDVGLGNVDNTSDANKPVSTAQQTALDNKVDRVSGKQLSTEDYTSAEKTKLAGIASGATANATDAQLRDRSTHTGTQPISSVEGLQAALDSKLNKAKSLLTGSHQASTVPAGATYYNGFVTGAHVTTQSSEFQRRNLIPVNCILSNFTINLGACSGTGTVVVTLRKNGIDTGVVITIPCPSVTGFFTAANTLTCEPNDIISYKILNNTNAVTGSLVLSSVVVEI